MQTTKDYSHKASGIIQRIPCTLKATLMARAPVGLAGTPYFTEGGRQHHCRRKSLQGKHKDAFRFFPPQAKTNSQRIAFNGGKILSLSAGIPGHQEVLCPTRHPHWISRLEQSVYHQTDSDPALYQSLQGASKKAQGLPTPNQKQKR